MKKENKTIIEVDKYIENIKNELNDIIKESTYPELIKYKKMLPGKNEGEKSFFYWGMNYLNEYYKVMRKLDKIHTLEIKKLKYKIYILYLKENFYDIVFTFQEFITFSRLINATFSDYNPSKIRKEDKEPFQSENKKIENIVNKIAYNSRHTPCYHAYEVTEFKLKILLDVIDNKSKTLLKEEFDKINLDDPLIICTLSKKRRKELERKQD